MPVTTNTRKLAALLGASGAGIGTDGLLQAAAVDANVATQAELDESDNRLTTNLAVLAIRQAADHNDVKYNLQDRIIDDYYDASGIDGTPSTNHTLTSGVYSGGSTVTTSGGTATIDGAYTVRSITATGSTNFVTDAALTVDYLIVGGGGAGGMGDGGGGGGGAGGYISATSQSLAAGTFAAVVGTGGTGIASNIDGAGGHGTDSSFNSQIAGGGAGGPANDNAGVAGNTANGGSGSGNSGGPGTGSGGAAGTQGTANAGGSGTDNNGGGGGGAGAVGGNAVGTSAPGNGGVGLSNSITGSAVYYAGGGGGSTETTSSGSSGGNGGGGNGGIESSTTNATDGTDGKGGGGGGGERNPSSNGSGDGGNGVVIVRYLTATASIDNLTLQSTDTEAETQPDYADMVMLVEDAGSGVGAVQTHIKGWVSRDSGTTFTQGTLVDEGDWGTDKRILAFHDLDISGQPADQTMCYKITTHSASAVYNTKIHATSIGWR